jgi:hypothetical protein
MSPFSHGSGRRWFGDSSERVLLLVLFVAFFAEGVFFVVHGRFNIDEGLHLNAGRLLYEQGWMLYRDFPFSQGPGGPFFYGPASALFENAVLAGRCFSLGMGLICVASMAWFASRVVGVAGALLVLLWTLVAFPAVWSFTQIRTEPVAIALTLMATIALFFRDGSMLRWALAPTLLVWATTFRLTSVIPLVAVCLLIAFDLRRSPRRLLAVAGIVLANGLVASMPMWIFPDESFFHVVVAQASRAERFGWTEVPFMARFRFFSNPATGFPSLLLMSVLPLSVIAARWREGWRPGGDAGRRDPAEILVLLFAMALLSYAPHVLSRQGFSQYFANASLLLVLALAIGSPLVARRSVRHAAIVWGAVAAAWLLTAVVGVRQIETWVLLKEPTVTHFDKLRDTVQRLSPDGCEILTFETHLAVQIGCAVTPGLEYSLFSFFPLYSEQEAHKYGVLNSGLLIEHLVEDSPEFVALTWSGVSRMKNRFGREGTAPMFNEMAGHYRPLTRINVPVGPTFVFWDEVYVYVRSDLMGRDD